METENTSSTVKPKSRAHLWKKGVSGNPGGRPKKSSTITGQISRYLDDVPNVTVGGRPNTKTWRELISQAWLMGCYKGNPVLIKELLDRTEGKILQTIGVGGTGDPIQTQTIPVDLSKLPQQEREQLVKVAEEYLKAIG